MTLSVPPSDPRARCHPLRQNLSRAEAGLLLGVAALLLAAGALLVRRRRALG